MRVAVAAALFLAGLFVAGSVPLLAQTPAPAPASATTATQPAPVPAQVDDSDVGFNYSLPADWEFVAPPRAPRVTVPFPDAMGTKKGDACVEVVLTAKHGTPASVVVVMALPFACYGQSLKSGDLANFGAGAAEGMKQTFDVSDPVQSNYTLGSNAVWIERAKGTPKGHPENPFTFEIACTLLAKGAVCWMTMAADAASLQAFENSPVMLDGESSAALVPASAFLPNSP
jgi:hypothetical protein